MPFFSFRSLGFLDGPFHSYSFHLFASCVGSLLHALCTGGRRRRQAHTERPQLLATTVLTSPPQSSPPPTTVAVTTTTTPTPTPPQMEDVREKCERLEEFREGCLADLAELGPVVRLYSDCIGLVYMSKNRSQLKNTHKQPLRFIHCPIRA